MYGKQLAHNATDATYRAAKELGIEVIDEAEYRNRLEGNHAEVQEINSAVLKDIEPRQRKCILSFIQHGILEKMLMDGKILKLT